jgi:hypothetical protein
LSQPFTIVGINSDVTQGSCAVVLDIDIGRGKKLNQDWYSASVNELLPVII